MRAILEGSCVYETSGVLEEGEDVLDSSDVMQMSLIVGNSIIFPVLGRIIPLF
jgi:hypothetical protein